MEPIYNRLKSGDFAGVIYEIGGNEPFVLSSPNLFVWRSIAFYAVKQFDRAIEDMKRYLSSAPKLSASDFVHFHQTLSDTGEMQKLIEAQAKERLPPKELEQFYERIAVPPE
jgi:hypothetical protein